MDINTKADAEAWLRVAEKAVRQDHDTPEDQLLSCRGLLEMVLPLVRRLAEVLS